MIQGINISWLGHAGFKIKTDKVIYIDPFQLRSYEPADIIFITHEHYDHCSVDDIAKIVQSSTTIVTVADCQSKLSSLGFKEMVLVEPNKKYSVEEINFEAVPAYNTNKQFHPKENEWVGFIIEVNGKRVYHAGDTDFIPEMNSLKNIDIALVPVSGTYVMTAKEAVNAVDSFKPKTAIPMHYGAIVGDKSDAQKFKELARTAVIILEKA